MTKRPTCAKHTTSPPQLFLLLIVQLQLLFASYSPRRFRGWERSSVPAGCFSLQCLLPHLHARIHSRLTRGGDAGEDVVPGPAFVKGPGLIVRILLITGKKNYDYNYERPGEVVCPGPVLTVGGPSYTQWTPVITEKPGKDRSDRHCPTCRIFFFFFCTERTFLHSHCLSSASGSSATLEANSGRSL